MYAEKGKSRGEQGPKESKNLMKTILFATLVLGAGLLGGCKSASDSVINKATDTPDFDKNVLAKTTESCVNAANEKIANRTPESDKMIHTYCDCYAHKIQGGFTHAELVDLGIKGMGSLTPAQQAKMDDAVKVCEAQVGLN